ncbi:hypothetical protein LTR70_006860 [Exophiala xenobiotica]|nr:hypothetical protein LTR70_006860 [Exophiala xenobiotica]
MASHAARHGPNGALAFRTSLEPTDRVAEQSLSSSSSRNPQMQAGSSPATPKQQSDSLNPTSAEAALRKNYETILSRFDNVFTCAGSSGASDPDSKIDIVHPEERSLLEGYLDLLAQHELPFRVRTFAQQPVFGPMAAQNRDGLIAQCLLVAGQAAIDGLDPTFEGKASKRTLMLQQKALSVMQQLIAKRPNTLDDALMLASAVLMAIAAFFDDTDAYKAHKSSLRKMIDMQSGTNQTAAQRIIMAISAAGEAARGHSWLGCSFSLRETPGLGHLVRSMTGQVEHEAGSYG